MITCKLGDTVTTRKPHACGCSTWEVLRTGADYKIKCKQCGHIVMLPNDKFHKAVKHVESTNTDN
ncbi:MAG: DUF951 domain-containing protein [Clostridia bacterium]|nr:DUF951 domain-containing protein [Clostridia bacterium]